MAKNTNHKQQKQYYKQFNKDLKNGPHQKNLKKKRIYLADSNEQGILCAMYIIFN